MQRKSRVSGNGNSAMRMKKAVYRPLLNCVGRKVLVVLAVDIKKGGYCIRDPYTNAATATIRYQLGRARYFTTPNYRW